MSELIYLDKQQLFPQEQDFIEAARYLGYSKINLPQEKEMKMIKECCVELLEEINAQALIDEFELVIDEEKNVLEFAGEKIISKDLCVNLKGCKKVFLLASTIGPKVDSLIRKNEMINPVKAAIFQACGAMFVEKLVDYVNEEIKKKVCSKSEACKPRFSPGYGDLDLCVQKIFFKLLPCTKIGLTLMDTLIMSPEKSVTAFVGVKN